MDRYVLAQFGRVFSSESTSVFLKMKNLYAPNHKFYEQYYIDQAEQKGGNFTELDVSEVMA